MTKRLEAFLNERRRQVLHNVSNVIVRDLASRGRAENDEERKEQRHLGQRLESIITELNHLENGKQSAGMDPGPEPTFADKVHSVATRLTTPPFQDRVAIAQLYDAYGRLYPDAGPMLHFKERLVEAGRHREVPLGRLDLPERMDDMLRERSAARWGHEDVHFVLTGAEHRQAWQLSASYRQDMERRARIENTTSMLFAHLPGGVDETTAQATAGYDLVQLRGIASEAERADALLAMGNSAGAVSAYADELRRQAPETALDATQAVRRAEEAWNRDEAYAYAVTSIPLWPDVDLDDPAERNLPSTQRALRHNEAVAHIGALQDAGTDEAAFHQAFEAVKTDPGVDADMARHIAHGYTGRQEDWTSKEAAFGAVEEHFYRHQQEQLPERTAARGGAGR